MPVPPFMMTLLRCPTGARLVMLAFHLTAQANLGWSEPKCRKSFPSKKSHASAEWANCHSQLCCHCGQLSAIALSSPELFCALHPRLSLFLVHTCATMFSKRLSWCKGKSDLQSLSCGHYPSLFHCTTNRNDAFLRAWGITLRKSLLLCFFPPHFNI